MRFSSLFVAPVLSIAPLLVLATADTGDIHGPICSWHLDPTTTMTIQWVEKAHTTIPQERWWEAVSGFGYGDDDDTTVLDMQDKYQRLYIRTEFEGKDLPTVAQIDPTGAWTAKAQIDKAEYEFNVRFDFKEGNLSGDITQLGGQPKAFEGGYIGGETVHFQSTYTLLTKEYTIEIAAKRKDGVTLEGEWRALNKEGEEKAKDKVVFTKIETEEEKKKREAMTDEEKKKAEEERKKEAAKVADPDKFQIQLRVRYDDGFIAYLNGEEIQRAGIGSGRGKDAKDIANHDADKEETFTIDKKFNRLLKPGKNILAFEGHNRAIDSSDFTLDPKLWVKVDKKEHKYLDGKNKWQFFLGEPAANWTTSEIRSKPLPTATSGVEPYELRFGKRGAPVSLPHRAVSEVLEFADTRNVIHRVILKGLEPDTGYAFEISEPNSTRRLKGKKFFFKTAPTRLGDGVTFVTGGDMYHKRDLLDAMNREAAEHNPLFALLGGDLAYANGKDAHLWYDWIDSWHDWCETSGDYMIPMIVAIGNHECSKQIDSVKEEDLKDFKPEEHAKFFYSLFPLPEGKSSYAVDFADYMSIICLDSNHTQRPEDQVPWLKAALRDRSKMPNLFTCYHRPTFGTLVKDDEKEVREHFVPLFDQYGVDAAFENDHHLYKRTMPIKGGEIHKDGTIYIGDGSWGVNLRDVPWEKTNKLDYLVRAAKENHLIRVQVLPDRQQYDAFNGSGTRLDSYARFR